MAHRLAIIADAHFHDPAGDFGGAGLEVGGRRLALRSWADTSTGPRAFNETARVLTAALERIAALGLRHVVLAGDYTDDGQAENTRRLAALLAKFEARHGMRFYATPGNHDLFGPLGKDVTTRFISAPGQTVMVTSDAEQAAIEGPGAVLTAALRCAGQPAALDPMARFGYFRRPEDLHWESPFGPQDQPEHRTYQAHAADGSVSLPLMDASYLVEPEAGLWLLMIDANVFEPRPGRTDPSRKKTFIGPSDAGWTSLLRLKPFLLDWIRDVTGRARALGKTLVTTSHYPVLDPFQDGAGSEVALYGQTTVARRSPAASVGHRLIAAGLRWHLGGHMHVNATTHLTTPEGSLTDLSLPSLVAFPPAFKVIAATPAALSAQTVTMADLPPDPDLSALYQAEGRQGPALPFGAFLADQRRTHLVTRQLPKDWPAEALALLPGRDAGFLLDLCGTGEAETSAEFTRRHGLPAEALQSCALQDLVLDANLIRTAGPLAPHWVPTERLHLYRALAATLGDDRADPARGHAAFFARFLSVLGASLDRMATDDTCPVRPEGQRVNPLAVPVGAQAEVPPVAPAAAGASHGLPPRYP